MRRYAFIYNPAACRGNAESKLQLLEKQIKTVSGAKLFRSSYKGEISDLIEDLLPQYDVFVACGGDGTIREMASKLVHTQKKMGIIPMGTGNDLCKTLQIPTDIQGSLDILWAGRAVKMDVGQCNDFIFLNTLGFGFDGLTNRYAHEYDSSYPLFQYGSAALKAIVTHKQFKVQVALEKTVSRTVIRLWLANGRVEGGAFWIAPDASVTDGKLNLVTIKPISKWAVPFLLPFLIFKKTGWISQLQSQEVDQLDLRFEGPVEIHADGEIIDSNTSEFSIRLIPNTLEVICGL